MRRGILGGTFDPPHLAHLVAAEAAYHQLGLDVVTFVPAGAPWQKDGSGVSDARHRWAMTGLAVAGVDYFDADDREVNRPGWTFTADTLESYPDDEELVLILGSDAAAGIPSWSRPEAVLGRASVAVMERPGTTDAVVTEAIGPHHLLNAPTLEVSGTMLRAWRHHGGSMRFMVREAVHRYILDAGLYGAE